jgi:hypothetical protein
MAIVFKLRSKIQLKLLIEPFQAITTPILSAMLVPRAKMLGLHAFERSWREKNHALNPLTA